MESYPHAAHHGNGNGSGNGNGNGRSASHSTPIVTLPDQRSETDFLNQLFHSLAKECVRYCVLQRWDALLEELHTDHDVDLVVHPKDAGKLRFVWKEMHKCGYTPIHLLNHEVNAYAFVFAWFENLSMRTVMVDIAFEHRQSGLIWKSGEELLNGRQLQGNLWVSDPGVELAYLLVKKMLKGTFKPSREQRYKLLVDRMGQHHAKAVITELFGKKRSDEILTACERADLGPVLRPLRKGFLLKRYVRNPFNLVRYVTANHLRLARRWFQPTGLTLALLGTSQLRQDNVYERVVEVLTPAFGVNNVKWRKRPAVPEHDSSTTSENFVYGHSKGTLKSTLDLLLWFFNYWARYAFRIRPLVARTHLVVLDRYFHEGLVDSNTDQLMGPVWVARLLSRLTPKPDLLLFLDSQDEGIASGENSAEKNPRKQRLPSASSRRAGPHSKTDQTVREASQLFMDHLAQRFQSRHSRWLGVQS
ncbi:MAG: hypothetical protein ACRD4K_00585 [Candidatus Acidiferrales bacterium]